MHLFHLYLGNRFNLIFCLFIIGFYSNRFCLIFFN